MTKSPFDKFQKAKKKDLTIASTMDAPSEHSDSTIGEFIDKVPTREIEGEKRVNFYIRKTFKDTLQGVASKKNMSLNAMVLESLSLATSSTYLESMPNDEIMKYYRKAKIDEKTFQVPKKEALQLVLPESLIEEIEEKRKGLIKRLQIDVTKGIFIEILLLMG